MFGTMHPEDLNDVFHDIVIITPRVCLDSVRFASVGYLQMNRRVNRTFERFH